VHVRWQLADKTVMGYCSAVYGLISVLAGQGRLEVWTLLDGHDEFNDDNDDDDHHEGLEMMTLEEALRKAEEQVAKTRGRPDLDYALVEAVVPAMKETWRDIYDRKDDRLSASRSRP
jgi:hypothetical protein